MSLATMGCGRHDSNLHGLPGFPRSRKFLGLTASGFQSRRVYRFRHARVTLFYGSARAMICIHLCRWFHAYATLVHRAGLLLSTRPFYSTIALIIRFASATPRLLSEYLLPFLVPADWIKSARARSVGLIRFTLTPDLLADFFSAVPVTAGI